MSLASLRILESASSNGGIYLLPKRGFGFEKSEARKACQELVDAELATWNAPGFAEGIKLNAGAS